MNISNTISYDSKYSKNESTQPEIKQSVPVVKDKIHFSDKLDEIDKIEPRDKKDRTVEIADAVDKSNVSLQAFDRKLVMSVHQKTREVMIKVVDTITDEVIREIPAEKVLDTVASRREMLGILVDQKI